MTPPPGLAFAQPYPGATTCILLGALPTNGRQPDLSPYRAVLWLAPPAAHPPRLAPGTRLEPLRLDQNTSTTIGPALENFLRQDARRLPSFLITEEAVRTDRPACQTALARIHAELESHHRARITRQQDGFAWQRHVLQNLPAYVQRRLPSGWRGALTGCPAFVCGAGPSLDISAPALARIASQGIVLAADSALRTLARHGIAADFAVSIDVAKHPENCLVPDASLPGHIVLAPVSPPAWRTALPPARIFFVANHQLTPDWLVQLGLAAPALTARESCGVTALELAHFLDCAPIHLFGLDLALSDGRRHTTGAETSQYARSGFDATQAYPTVPGNYATAVPTHVIGDWRSLDQRLAAWPAGLVHNVTDRGARLANTTLVHPDNLTLDGGGIAKPTVLAALPGPDTIDPDLVSAALGVLRDTGRRESGHVAALRTTLARGGPPALAAALRPLFADRTLGRTLGGFSLKIMPHLLPPTEGDAAFWNALLDEYAELLEHASALP